MAVAIYNNVIQILGWGAL